MGDLLGERSIRVVNYQVPLDDPVKLQLAGRKPLVHARLPAEGLPVRDHRRFDVGSLAEAEAFLAEQDSACVVKPAGSYGGRGVTLHLENARGVRRAALLASLEGSMLLIERQVPGEIHPECESAAVRAAAAIVQLAGVDFIALDATAPLVGNAVVNKVNTTPALQHHYDSTRESHPFVAVEVLRELLEVPSAVGGR